MRNGDDSVIYLLNKLTGREKARVSSIVLLSSAWRCKFSVVVQREHEVRNGGFPNHSVFTKRYFFEKYILYHYNWKIWYIHKATFENINNSLGKQKGKL